MDAWQAQQAFWGQFGAAYEENSVPNDAGFPRITYQAAVNSLDNDVAITASIWTRSTSWNSADMIANAIKERIKDMGCPKIDGGRYRVYIGSTPFAQKTTDPDDKEVKRIVINVNFEFMTE